MINDIENEFVLVSCKKSNNSQLYYNECYINNNILCREECTYYKIRHRDFISCTNLKVDWITYILYNKHFILVENKK